MIALTHDMDRRRLLALAALAALPPEARAQGEKKKAGGDTYLAMDTLLGATFRANGQRGVLSVDCGIDVPDPALHKLADQSIPRLRAAYLQIIQSYAAGLQPGMLPNADYIAATLQRQTDAQLGRKGARLLVGAILVN